MSKTFADLMGGHKTAEIFCLYTGKLARRLTVDGDTVSLDALTVTVDVPLTTVIHFEPWVFDRGNMLFYLDTPGMPSGDPLKLCGESDLIRFADGTEGRVEP